MRFNTMMFSVSRHVFTVPRISRIYLNHTISTIKKLNSEGSLFLPSIRLATHKKKSPFSVNQKPNRCILSTFYKGRPQPRHAWRTLCPLLPVSNYATQATSSVHHKIGVPRVLQGNCCVSSKNVIRAHTLPSSHVSKLCK